MSEKNSNKYVKSLVLKEISIMSLSFYNMTFIGFKISIFFNKFLTISSKSSIFHPKLGAIQKKREQTYEKGSFQESDILEKNSFKYFTQSTLGAF